MRALSLNKRKRENKTSPRAIIIYEPAYEFRATERAHIIGLMFSDRPSGSEGVLYNVLTLYARGGGAGGSSSLDTQLYYAPPLPSPLSPQPSIRLYYLYTRTRDRGALVIYFEFDKSD